MTNAPINESDIKLILVESAWKDLGISMSTSQPTLRWLADTMNLFLFSKSYKDAYAQHFSNPVNQRGGLPDDWNLQQFTIDITQRWKVFIIERLDLAPIHPYEIGPNQERSY